MSNLSQSANRQIARAAGTVMAAFVLSNLTGLVRQILISNAFGTRWELDAFSAASTFPDLIFSLIAGGALASAFIPTFAGLLAREERAGAWYLASAIINLVILLLTLTSIFGIMFAPQIVRQILAPELPLNRQVVAISLLRILLIAPTIFGVSGLFMGILNAHQVFLWPALAPSMYWLGMIFGVLFLVPSMGIYGLAWGAVLGAALHMLVQIPAILRLPSRVYRLTFGLANPAVREVGRLMGPRLIGVAVVQLNFVVNTIIATGQPEGSLAAIKYAWQIMTMPQVVIAQAIAIAALPTFSAQVARGELVEMRSSLAATLRGVILLALPAAVGLILLRQPVIAMLFERGAFDAHSTSLVSWALLWYSVGLLGHSIVEIVARAFYALHDTKTPVFIGAVAMSLNIVFSIVFAEAFIRIGWMPHGGLALANSLATGLETIGLLFLMRRRLKGLQGRSILQGMGKAILASALLAGGVGAWLFFSRAQPAWLVGFGGVAVGAVCYSVGVFVFRVPEARVVLDQIAGRFSTSRP